MMTKSEERMLKKLEDAMKEKEQQQIKEGITIIKK